MPGPFLNGFTDNDPFTPEDAAPILQALRTLEGFYGIQDVFLVGSLAERGQSTKDADIVIRVNTHSLDLTAEQVLTSDNTWPAIHHPEDLDPPASQDALHNVQELISAIEGVLVEHNCATPDQYDDVLNTECRLPNGRWMPVDLFLTAEVNPPG